MLFGMAAAGAALGYAYAVNAIGDRTSDTRTEKNPLAGLGDVPPSALGVTLAAAVASLGVSLPLGLFASACIATSLFAATVYSVGPRAKSYPVAGLVANTLIFVPLLFACGEQPSTLGGIVPTFVALLVQNQLVHELSDADEDARGGDLTTARLLGPAGVRVACVLVAAAAAVYVWREGHDPVTTSVAAIALCSGALCATLRDASRARRTHRALSMLGGAAQFLIRMSR